MSIQQAVTELRARGLNVCRILPGEKLPGYAGWSARTLEPADFTDVDSVGIVCGPVNAARFDGRDSGTRRSLIAG